MTNVLLDRYEIIRVIGKGGMGMVYEAREIGTGRRVAVKWMHEQSFPEGDPNLLRFQQEARIAGALDSPHVTAVYECAREPVKNVIFQVMELLEGEDLSVLLDRVGAVEPATALRIAMQACAGLSAAHAAGVVHRDIKPDNIFLSHRGQNEVIVKLLDFGIAKIRRSKEMQPGVSGSIHSMTSSGEMLGTPLYMAPEQFEGAKHVDARADVYSMGVTLYALLAGAPPHAHLKSFMQILRAITMESAPPLRERAPWVRPGVIAVVEKAMQVDPNARYAHATEMLGALTGLVEGSSALTRDKLVGMSAEQKSVVNAEAMADTVVQGPRDSTPGPGGAKAPWWKKILGR